MINQTVNGKIPIIYRGIKMSDVEKLIKPVFDKATLGLFKSPDMPEIEDPALAPDPESLEDRRKKEREMKRRGGSGRAGTILTESNKLG